MSLNPQDYEGLKALIYGHSLGKISLFFLVWIILWLPLAIPLAWRLKWQPWQPLTPEQKLPLIASLYGLVPVLMWGVIKLEGSSLKDYGLAFDSHLGLSLLLGLILGVMGLALIFGVQTSLGWIQWHPEKLKSGGLLLLPLLGLGLWVGITEELIFRGLFLNQLTENYSLWIAGGISSSIFALVHLVWEQKNTLPQLPGLGLMGMVLVGARIIDGGSLGLAWGLHAGWVWGLGLLDAAALMSYTGKGSPWLTGLGGQPLAGVAGIVCLLLTGAVLFGFSGV